jgi:serine protease Do
MFFRVCAGILFFLYCVTGAFPVGAQQLTREEKVLRDRERIEAEGFWIYNDLQAGFAEANRTGKPLLVVLRCVPCEECVKLDDDLIDRDPVLRPLLERFVCVRQVSTNGLDLKTFQFDTDQSFATFMLNGDGTIYGRFGTRSHRTDWIEDVSVPGLAAALEGALLLHAKFPSNQEQLAGKMAGEATFDRPELYPGLKEKYTSELARSGSVVASCIHCHQIGDAERDLFRSRKQPIPDEVLFPYPHPDTIGLKLDPRYRANIREVAAGSIAAQAGLQAGDRILRLNMQPILSIADVQWVLQQTPASGGTIDVTFGRGAGTHVANLTLPDGWRLAGNLSWRVSTWGLRRMATGGMTLEPLDDEQRQRLDIASGHMALRVKSLGKWGPHATALKAGFQTEDVIVKFDGQDDLLREADLIRHGVRASRAGDVVSVQVIREGRPVTLKLPMQP